VANRDIIVIGGSAGSFKPLFEIVHLLPPDLHIGVLVTIHRASLDDIDHLPAILSRKSHLRVGLTRDGEAFEPGHIYNCPASGAAYY